MRGGPAAVSMTPPPARPKFGGRRRPWRIKVANAWFYNVLLAELERETLGTDSALARIDEALALARHVDNRCSRISCAAKF